MKKLLIGSVIVGLAFVFVFRVITVDGVNDPRAPFHINAPTLFTKTTTVVISDGVNPRAHQCDHGANGVKGSGTPLRGPTGHFYGTLLVRESTSRKARCASLKWPRVTIHHGLDGVVHFATIRKDDGGALVAYGKASASLGHPYGKAVFSHDYCVEVSAYVSHGRRRGPTATTPNCRSGLRRGV